MQQKEINEIDDNARIIRWWLETKNAFARSLQILNLKCAHFATGTDLRKGARNKLFKSEQNHRNNMIMKQLLAWAYI